MSYTLIQQYNEQHIHLKFDGPFQDQIVVWDTHFYTLNGYKSENDHQDTIKKQFIDIKPSNSNHMQLTVALKIEEISLSNIQKMIIMIKQYKGLSIGRHEYG